ncbi:MAG: Ig-like domain-containing protein [Candidatus Saccharibacteria bacterium]
MEPQQNNLPTENPPAQANGVMVDLLHPQEMPPAPAAPPTPPAPAAPAPAPAPVAPAPTLQSQFTPPPVPTPHPVQIGSTQMPGAAKPTSRKKPFIITFIAILLLAIIGVVVYILMHKNVAPATPTTKVVVKAGEVTNLAQSSTEGILAAGAVTKQATIVFAFDFQTSANGGSVIPEVEVQPIDTHFTDKATISGQPVSASGNTLHLMAQSEALKDGNYHWQARIRVGNDNGPWKAYDVNPFSFGVATGVVAAPAAPVVDSVGGVKVADGKVTATTVRPVFYGTAAIGSSITLAIKPGSTTYKATTDNSGAWTITPTADLATGDHAVTVTAKPTSGDSTTAEVAVSIAPVVAEATPTPSATPDPAATPSATPTPTPSATPAPVLAPTGDPVVPIMGIAFAIFLLALFGLHRMTPRHER